MAEKLTEDQIISMVYSYSQTKPEFPIRVINAAIQGIQEKANKSHERACDMETLASVAFGIVSDGKKVTKKTKEYFEKLALAKLEKYDFQTNWNWNWAVEKKEK